MTIREGRAIKVRVPINGAEQGMFLDIGAEASPVLLFLHGGPGMPEYWLTRRYPTRMGEAFTVAWWEQRGAGLSYRQGIPATTMTVEQHIDDALEVARYLCRRFGVEKVHLMAHSWGSFIGLQAAARAPELFHSYIGMAQVTHQIASEQEAHHFMVEQYRARGGRRMVRRLERAPVTDQIPLPRRYGALRDAAMHCLGVGTTHDMRSVITGIFLPSWASPDYNLREKMNLWRGRRFSRGFGLWDQMLATDLTRRVTRLQIPAYFLHGRHDFTVSYPLAKSYATRLDAPQVGFYTFENSAHSPGFEEPDLTLRILTEDVLALTTTLADPPDPGGDGPRPPAAR
ncbi:MAG: alpha/beta hydrolase [Actinobacteria bacterium HGW-Actinobacteria-8]|nr:MAG: alpha/beta hydrolase [Actinobacteria bacterium HGW-Actinobacteria-8]